MRPVIASARHCDPSASGTRLLEHGVVLLRWDGPASQRDTTSRGEHPLLDLCCHCPMLTSALRPAVGRALERADDERRTSQILPGVWASIRASAEGSCAISLLLTRTLLTSEHVSAMCQSAELDHRLVQAALGRLSLCNDAEALQRLEIIDQMRTDEHLLGDLTVALESMGQDLASSYEEINLLYSTIESMSVVEDPRRFVGLACERLLQTLPFTWIGVLFCDEQPWLTSLAGELIVAGEPPACVDEMRQRCQPLLELAGDGGSRIIEGSASAASGTMAGVGDAAVVQPIRRQRHDASLLAGVMLAVDKRDDDITSFDTKLVSATASHLAIFLENAALYEDLAEMFLGTVQAMTAAIDAKDRYTCGHSERVALLTRQLALAAGVDDAAAERMHIAGLVHDVGKIGVPESVLTKPGRLTADEFALVQLHPEIGHRILKDIPQLRDVLPGVLHHHERWEGGGYPTGLAGDAIPRIARIITLADAFDAMSSNRSYRSSMPRAAVLQEVRDQSGRQFDPDLAPIFVDLDFTEYDCAVANHAESR